VSARRVVVVGTTSDYIDVLCRRFPGRALFITDPRERAKASEPDPDPASEVLCDLSDPAGVLAALRAHLSRWAIAPSGIACYDDESMALAAALATAFSLPYASAEAVSLCRSKFACKQAWRRAGLPCPAAELVRTEAEVLRFHAQVGAPVVLKPLTGSGSEFPFLCNNEGECAAAVRALRVGLGERRDARMYAPQGPHGERLDPRQVFVNEEFVQGTECSCDFIVDGARVEIIRLASKIAAHEHSFGTTLAYIVPGELPATVDPARFRRQLLEAAHALGIERSICMLDFVVRDGEAVMLEMAPRLGGDCLPPLVRQSCGLDTLGMVLDFAERRPVAIPAPSQWRRLVGLRLFASQAGVISGFDVTALVDDRRVLECHLKRRPGHRVELPPDDYDSRLLGHVVFEPQADSDVAEGCRELAAKLVLDTETAECATPTPC